MISIIVATSENHTIGRDNQLLWHLPNDLKFFKRVTSGNTVIMGRKTYESIGKALPNRRNIVISRQENLKPENVEVVSSLERAITLAESDEKDVFIIGGGQKYTQALPLADRIYLTKVSANIDGDTYFPELSETEWTVTEQQDFPVDEKHAYAYSFLVLDRMRPGE